VVELLPEIGVLTHPEAVAPDVDDVAVVQEAIDKSGGHDFVAEDLAPPLETPPPPLHRHPTRPPTAIDGAARPSAAIKLVPPPVNFRRNRRSLQAVRNEIERESQKWN